LIKENINDGFEFYPVSRFDKKICDYLLLFKSE
jgi:hypothetical protein